MKKKKAPRGTKLLRTMRKYCADVLDGTIPACKWTKLACQRFLDDLARTKSEKSPYYFDAAQADRVWRFIELLSHVKGRWARKDPKNPDATKLRLTPFQIFIVGNIFGWLRKSDNKRRFRKASIYLPRKNAKSTLAAAIGHWMAWMDDEPGAEVYAGATTEKQAMEVFGPARLMVKNEPQMASALDIEVGSQRLFRTTDASKFQPIIGKPGDGASPHLSITDEYHEHDTSEQYDTMITGMGAREQPLALIISTAGDNIAGPCYDDCLTVRKVLEKTLEDETHFGIIYTADEEDDWTAEETIVKANPNIDVSVSREYLLQQQKDAMNNARKQGTFKTKHLNIWVQARNAYINMQRWAECKANLKLEDFVGRRCIMGLDLASKVDIAALMLLFEDEEDPEECYLFGKYYLPQAAIEMTENQHYQKWKREGWLTETEGNIIDFDVILEDIIAMSSKFEVSNVGYDPHQATMFITSLQKKGVPCIEVRPTVLNFSEPMKQVEALVRDRKLHHDGNPVTTWMFSNVVAREDAKDNVYPRKERNEKKIDGFVATVSAMAVKMNIKTEEPKEYQILFAGAPAR